MFSLSRLSMHVGGEDVSAVSVAALVECGVDSSFFE